MYIRFKKQILTLFKVLIPSDNLVKLVNIFWKTSAMKNFDQTFDKKIFLHACSFTNRCNPINH